MLFRKILKLRNDVLDRSYTYFSIGKDIYEYSRERILEHIEETEDQEDSEIKASTGSNKTKSMSKKAREREKRRANLRKQMEKVDDTSEDFIRRRQESMLNSQGVADHSGSSYHGPGKPGDKTNANMWQRNFENHQGN